MASLELIRVRNASGANPILDDLSLPMAVKELVAFLRPSGFGKSALLRVIASLETADAGKVHQNGKGIDALFPGDRGVAKVFQHYALYPHMTVRDNMAFRLRNARVTAAEIATRVADAARVMEIEQHLDSKPGQTSGGQRVPEADHGTGEDLGLMSRD